MCGSQMDEESKFCFKCGAKLKQSEATTDEHEREIEKRVPDQKVTDIDIVADKRSPAVTALIISIVFTALFSFLCCFLPFVSVRFFGTHSFSAFDLIIQESKLEYIVGGCISAIFSTIAIFVTALASLVKSRLFIECIVFACIGAVSAFVAVSDDLNILGIGFILYELLSVATVILSVVALTVGNGSTQKRLS